MGTEAFAARVAELAGEEPAAEETPAAETPAPETPAADAPDSPAPAEDPEVAARRAVIEAKLAEARDRRAAANLSKKAKAAAAAAEADRKAVAAEKAKYDSLKAGTFKETLEALGRDPRKAFEEMQREAVEAGTPEAEIRRMRSDFEQQMNEKLAPLQQTIEKMARENEQLQHERAELAKRAHDSSLVNAFQSEVQDPEYSSLRIEYEDSDLLAYVRHFDRNPQAMYAEAKRYGVRLTSPEKGFTMREILNVLKSAQDAHEQGRQKRAAKLAPAAPSAATPSVNGTVSRSNAGTTIGNDVTGERAAPSRAMSRRERIDAEIERAERR